MKTLHDKAVALAKTYRRTEGELLEVLMELDRSRYYLELGHGSLFEYITQGLGLSEAQACYFVRVGRKAVEVPALREAISQGELTLSQARRLVPVIETTNAQAWIETAKATSQRELERQVSAVNPKAFVRETLKPVNESLTEIRALISKETEAKLKRLQDLLSQKRRKPVSLGETVEMLVEETLKRVDPEQKALRARASSGRAFLKHAVVKRQGWRCAYLSPDRRRCSTKRHLDLHHLVPRSRGGKDHRR